VTASALDAVIRAQQLHPPFLALTSSVRCTARCNKPGFTCDR